MIRRTDTMIFIGQSLVKDSQKTEIVRQIPNLSGLFSLLLVFMKSFAYLCSQYLRNAPKV